MAGIPGRKSSSSGIAWRERIYHQPGIHTWSAPPGGAEVEVIVIGGGGAGQDQSSNSSLQDGGASSFGSFVTANGGQSGKDSSSGYVGGAGYDKGSDGYPSTYNYGPSKGGRGFMGIGAGGRGADKVSSASYVQNNRGAGGGSGYVTTYTGKVRGDQTVTVGAGASSGGNGPGYGQSGMPGAVIVRWREIL